MRRFIRFIILSSVAVSAVSAYADIKIAIVDGQKVIEASLAYKDITSQIEKKAGVFKNKAAKIQEDLQKKYKELESQKSILSNEAYSNKAKVFESESEKAQETVYMERISLDKAYSEATKSLEEKVSFIIKNKANEMNIDLVVNKMATFYSSSALDITESVAAELNKIMPTLPVKFGDVQDIKNLKDIKVTN